MKPIRAAGIVLKGDKVLLMHRVKNGDEYFTFPGGSVEENETIESAVLREILEETTLKVELGKEVYFHNYETSEGHYFLCEYLGGKPKLGESIEKERMEKGKDDSYKPKWVGIKKLKIMLIYPLEIRDWLIDDLENGFSMEVRVAKLKTSELRQTL